MMHIVREWLRGFGELPAMAYCGRRITRGAAKDAPMCKACMRRAGWRDGKPSAGSSAGAAALAGAVLAATV